MNQETFAALFLVLAGVYIFYFGARKIISEHFYLKHASLNEDRVLERYIRPIGWVILGAGFFVTGVYLF